MSDQIVNETSPDRALPEYESPKIQVMTEREVLNTFQITQAMQTWWGGCP